MSLLRESAPTEHGSPPETSPPNTEPTPIGVKDAIARRRSIRRYRPDPIPDGVLDGLLNALRLAPSGSNRQPWKFIVVRDEATKVKLAEACTYIRGEEVHPQMWIAQAPVVIVACGSEHEATTMFHRDGRLHTVYGQRPLEGLRAEGIGYQSLVDFDLAIALDHLSLAAVEEGLGTCWIGGLDEPKVKDLLSIPEDWRAPLAMPVGYPVKWPQPRSRKPLEEVVCNDRFS